MYFLSLHLNEEALTGNPERICVSPWRHPNKNRRVIYGVTCLIWQSWLRKITVTHCYGRFNLAPASLLLGSRCLLLSSLTFSFLIFVGPIMSPLLGSSSRRPWQSRSPPLCLSLLFSPLGIYFPIFLLAYFSFLNVLIFFCDFYCFFVSLLGVSVWMCVFLSLIYVPRV